MTGWHVTPAEPWVHVHPVADLRDHELTDTCWCGPTQDDHVMVHHAMDKREEYEEGRKTS